MLIEYDDTKHVNVWGRGGGLIEYDNTKHVICFLGGRGGKPLFQVAKKQLNGEKI